MTLFLLAAVVGVLVGIVVGALGAGGGILTVPVLVYLLGYEPHAAAAGSLVVVGSSALVSLIPHARAGQVRWREGAAFGGLGTIGALAGSRLATLVAPELLMVLLAVLLLVVAAVMLRDTATTGTPSEDRPRRRWLLVLAATVCGLLTGFFGVGGGFLVVPALLLVMGVGMRSAVGTSLLVIVINAAVGGLGRIGQSFEMDWWPVLAFAAASMIGGLLGARLSRRVRPEVLRRLFALLLAVVAVATALQAVPELLGA